MIKVINRNWIVSKGVLFLLLVFSALVVPMLISGNVSAHAPSAMYLSYDAGSETLTVYIDHGSDEPDRHYIETVTVSINRVEYLSKSYSTQKLDGGKGMVTYSYTVVASDRDVISVTAECSIDGSIMESLTVGDGDSKDDTKKDDTTKDDTTKDDTTRDDTSKDGTTKDDSDEKSGISDSIMLAIVGAVAVVIGIVIGFFVGKQKGQSTGKEGTIKSDEWTTCPDCGTSIQQKDLSRHIDDVHKKAPKNNAGKTTKDGGKRKVRLKD